MGNDYEQLAEELKDVLMTLDGGMNVVDPEDEADISEAIAILDRVKDRAEAKA